MGQMFTKEIEIALGDATCSVCGKDLEYDAEENDRGSEEIELTVTPHLCKEDDHDVDDLVELMSRLRPEDFVMIVTKAASGHTKRMLLEALQRELPPVREDRAIEIGLTESVIQEAEKLLASLKEQR